MAGGGDAAAEARLSSLDALGGQLFEFAERNTPDDVTGVGTDSDELAPWRLGAAVFLRGLPEPSAFRRDLAHVRHAEVRRRRHDVLRKIGRLAASAPSRAARRTRGARCAPTRATPAPARAGCALFEMAPLAPHDRATSV